ncbi:MAG: PAS domain S-box protein [Nitrospirae bacterium]|nr:PAS domain S-box protein [Nitrospirota bacterium]
MVEEGKILLVDDEIKIIEFIRWQLITDYPNMYTARSANEALHILRSNVIDVLVTDIKMPSMDGIELIRQAMSIQPHLQCIVITGHGDIDTAIEAMKIGAINYLNKPIGADELRIAVDRGFERLCLIRSLHEKEESLKNKNLELQKTIIELEKAKEELITVKSEIQHNLEIIESANSIILRMDTSGNIVYINKFGQDYFGYYVDELTGKNVMGTIVPEYDSFGRDLRLMIDAITVSPTKYAANENENMRKDGQRVWVVWTNKAVYDKDGNLQEILCIGSDRTYTKRLERELGRSERRFRNIFDTSPDAMFIAEIDTGIIVDANPAATRLLLRKKDEIVGIHQSLLHPTPTEDYSQHCLWGPKGGMLSAPLENKVVRSDGSIVWVEIIAELIQLDNKDCILGVFRDITIRKKMEEHIIKNEKMVSFDRLATRIAHEINNPLTSASMKIQTLKSKVKKINIHGTLYSKLRSIELGMERVSKLTKELMLVSRIQDTELLSVNLNDAINGAIIVLEDKLRGITLHLDLAEYASVMGDPIKIEQVFINIIDNSIYALPDKGDIFIRTFVQDAMVIVEVTDNGVGIKEENLKNIFDPFFTTRRIGEGTGLGLSICYGVIAQHGGTIDIISALGKGTSVIIKIPVGEEDT